MIKRTDHDVHFNFVNINFWRKRRYQKISNISHTDGFDIIPLLNSHFTVEQIITLNDRMPASSNLNRDIPRKSM